MITNYGCSTSSPQIVADYNLDALCDDMLAIADALGAQRWAAIGHDWGSLVAWRCALRYPDRVAAVFSLSVPHASPPPPLSEQFQVLEPGEFFYIRYFQQVGPPEAELEADVKASLKQIYFALSGDAPPAEWLRLRTADSGLLKGLRVPDDGDLSFMPAEVLDQYAVGFRRTGFFGPISWYRNIDNNTRQARAYGNGTIWQPAGFLAGELEVVLAMNPGGLENQRKLLSDLRYERIIPGAGHWIQQERPEAVTKALIDFLVSRE